MLLASTAVTAAVAEGLARLLLPPQQLVDVESTAVRRSRPGPPEIREQENGIDILLDWSGPHGVRLHPGVRATIHNHILSRRDLIIETNSIGLRHPELEQKTAGELRILVLGDSITFGDYLPFDETYSALLEQRLAGGPGRIRVINAGVPGASASDELYHYLEIRDAVDPDLVLLAMYLNDAQNSQRFYARSLPEPYASSRFASWIVNRVAALRVRLWSDETIPEIDPAWHERFRGGKRLQSGDMLHDQRAFDFEIYNAHGDFGLAWNPQSWIVLERIVRTLALAAREREQRVGAFLFPVHLQVKGTVEDFTPQESFLTMCRMLDLPCLDLVPALRETWAASGRELYYDHCHLTPDGNAVVSEALAKWLGEEGLLNR